MPKAGRGRWALWALIGALSLSGMGCQISIGLPKNKTGKKPVEKKQTEPQSTTSQKQPPSPSGVRQAQYEVSHPIAGHSPHELPAGQPLPGPIVHQHAAPPSQGPLIHGNRLPSEQNKVILPPYIIEPPDILFLDATRLVPKPPYRLNPLDVLIVQSSESLPQEPINGQYTVGPNGYISLGFSYGSVRVAGLTLRQVQRTLQEYVGARVRNAEVAVALAEFRGVQQTRGEHLVRPDGTISLGTYGCVNVTGLTLAQAKYAIEQHLSQYLQDPEISVDVFSYNSKAYYVILDGGGYGQQVFKFPSTGNETVLDAIQQIGGLPAVSSTKRIWVARPAPAGHKCLQVLPVNWKAIVMGGATETNYQLFPGDRVYVAADRFIALDNWLAKLLAPIERLFGITLLGVSTVRSFSSSGGVGNNIGFIGGF